MYESCIKKSKLIDKDKIIWAFVHGCLNTPVVWLKAAEEGNIEMFEWAKTERIPWESKSFLGVCKNDNIDAALWLHNNNYYCDKNELVNEALKTRAINILNWLKNSSK